MSRVLETRLAAARGVLMLAFVLLAAGCGVGDDGDATGAQSHPPRACVDSWNAQDADAALGLFPPAENADEPVLVQVTSARSIDGDGPFCAFLIAESLSTGSPVLVLAEGGQVLSRSDVAPDAMLVNAELDSTGRMAMVGYTYQVDFGEFLGPSDGGPTDADVRVDCIERGVPMSDCSGVR